MIVTGEVFEAVCVALWGKDWKAPASKRFKRSERQLLNIARGKCNVTRKLREALLAVVREQQEVLSAYEHQISG